MMTDPIADLLTRIRNAIMAKHETTTVPYSKMKEAIVKVLLEEGFIKNYQVMTGNKISEKRIKIYLKYDKYGTPVINSLTRISKPGRRIYKGYREIKKVLDTLGIAIISTPKGVMSDKIARKLKLGGEVICEVW